MPKMINVLKKVCSKYDRNQVIKDISSSSGGCNLSQRKWCGRVSILKQLCQGVVEVGTERTFQLPERAQRHSDSGEQIPSFPYAQ